MLELPEVLSRARELNRTVTGKRVQRVCPPSSAHKFCWFCGDPADYDNMLAGRSVLDARGFGIYVELTFTDDVRLCFNDGVNVRYYAAGADVPSKYQLCIIFDDGSALGFTVAMYGGILCHAGDYDDAYYLRSKAALSPLDDAFDKKYFEALLHAAKQNMSVKALLATEQRIPGLGNGVLQDILYIAGIHPKRKIGSLTQLEQEGLFDSVKNVLKAMTEHGGRDTEKNLFGEPGGYHTLLSKNTLPYPCCNCGGALQKETYLGGAIYYCPACQPLQKA